MCHCIHHHHSQVSFAYPCICGQLRILLYCYTVFAGDIDTQRHGAVGIFVADKQHMERYQGGSADYRSDLSELMKCAPVRWSAMHVCLPEGPLFSMLKALLVIVLVGTNERLRIKFYSGGLHNMETQYKLMSFGIPIQELPVTHSGTIKKKNHALWIKVRKLEDREREKTANGTLSFVEHPGVFDVLFRRGGYSYHYGNLLFQEAMLTELSDYDAVHSHPEKRRIREKIIQSIKAKDGRFLEYNKDDGVWNEIIDLTLVHNKVISAINDLNRMISARYHLQQIQSDTESFLNSTKRRKIDDDSLCRLG